MYMYVLLRLSFEISSLLSPILQGSKPTPILGELAQLSQESIAFDHLPLFAVLRRVVFIQNPSSHTLSFEWDLSSEKGQEVHELNTKNWCVLTYMYQLP